MKRFNQRTYVTRVTVVKGARLIECLVRCHPDRIDAVPCFLAADVVNRPPAD
jgi:hypothetical protein